MGDVLTVLPGLLPALALSFAVGLAAAPRVAAALHTRRLLAFGLLASLGAILGATLTPNAGGFEPAPGGAFCDLSRLTLAPLSELVSLRGEPSLNVLLFLPLGLVIGLLPRSHRTLLVLTAAVAVPIAIELLQGLLTPLNRSCSSADVVDNLTGFAVGLVLGSMAGSLWRRLSR